MDERQAASRRLFAQHTVTQPNASLKEVAQLLQRANAGKSAEDSMSEPMQDAALDFLKYLFTPIGFNQIDPDEDYAVEAGMALQILTQADDAHKDAFAEQVLFNVAHPANHQAMWAATMLIVPPDKMEALLLAEARSENELHVNNALHLPYYIYGRDPHYRLSERARAQLPRIIDDLKKRDGLNLLVKQGLDHVRIPVDL